MEEMEEIYRPKPVKMIIALSSLTAIFLIAGAFLLWSYLDNKKEMANWQKYQNSQYEFSLIYPKDWLLRQNQVDQNVVTFYQPGSLNSVQIYINYFPEKDLRCTELSECIDKFNKRLNVAENATLSDINDGKFMSFPAKFQQIVWKQPAVTAEQIFFFKNQDFYIFHFQADTANFEDSLSVKKKITASFKFDQK